MTKITAWRHQGDSRSLSSDYGFIVIASVDSTAIWSARPFKWRTYWRWLMGLVSP